MIAAEEVAEAGDHVVVVEEVPLKAEAAEEVAEEVVAVTLPAVMADEAVASSVEASAVLEVIAVDAEALIGAGAIEAEAVVAAVAVDGEDLDLQSPRSSRKLLRSKASSLDTS